MTILDYEFNQFLDKSVYFMSDKIQVFYISCVIENFVCVDRTAV